MSIQKSFLPYVLSGLFGAFLFAIPLASFAGVTVDTEFIEVELYQGEDFSKEITLSNDSSTKIERVNVFTHNVGPDGELMPFQSRTASGVNHGASLTSWLRIPRTVEIERNESTTVTLTVDTYEYTNPGEYEARISYPSIRVNEEKARLTADLPSTTLRVTILEVLEEVIETDLSYPKSLVLKGGPTATLRISNKGEETLVPSGKAQLTNKKGEVVVDWIINMNSKKIGPGEHLDEYFKFPQDTKLKLGSYTLDTSVKFGKRTRSFVQDTASFSYIPLTKVIILFILVILFIVGSVYFFDKKEE